LDEVEKAHPEVFDLLLQVLDDGRLTDGQGRTVDFRNTILVLTSNLGSSYLTDESMPWSDKVAAVQEEVRRAFKPEFVNRLDDIVVFSTLSSEDLGQIVALSSRSPPQRVCGWQTMGMTRPTGQDRCVV
jgi:ATP-dependent Clp protease ATP-binding subunit ClpB